MVTSTTAGVSCRTLVSDNTSQLCIPSFPDPPIVQFLIAYGMSKTGQWKENEAVLTVSDKRCALSHTV